MSIDQRFRNVVRATYTFVVCFIVAITIAKLLQCTPLEGNWIHGNAHCINRVALGVACSAITILSDIWVVVIPIPSFLCMSRRHIMLLLACWMLILTFHSIESLQN